MEQYQKEIKLLDEIWVKMKSRGKLPQIFIVIWKANLGFFFFFFFFLKNEKLIFPFLGLFGVEEKTIL